MPVACIVCVAQVCAMTLVFPIQVSVLQRACEDTVSRYNSLLQEYEEGTAQVVAVQKQRDSATAECADLAARIRQQDQELNALREQLSLAEVRAGKGPGWNRSGRVGPCHRQDSSCGLICWQHSTVLDQVQVIIPCLCCRPTCPCSIQACLSATQSTTFNFKNCEKLCVARGARLPC